MQAAELEVPLPLRLCLRLRMNEVISWAFLFSFFLPFLILFVQDVATGWQHTDRFEPVELQLFRRALVKTSGGRRARWRLVDAADL